MWLGSHNSMPADNAMLIPSHTLSALLHTVQWQGFFKIDILMSLAR